MGLEIIVRTSVLLAFAAVASRLLCRAAPATRHFVWHVSIVMVILAPLLMPLVPTFAVPIAVPTVRPVPMGANGWAPAMPAARDSVPTPVNNDSTRGTPAPGTLGTLGTIGTLGTLVVGIWFVFCWLLSGLSVIRGSRPAPGEWLSEARHVAARLGFTGNVDVRETESDGSPHVAGLLHSVVMMPPSARLWTTEERQAAFVHELTHIRRHDRRTQAMAQLACAIYWFNPLAWYAAAGLARERERACDDEVLRVGVKPSAYAALLLELARRPAAWTPATALSMARPSAIEGRLLMILADAVRTPRRSTRWLVGIVLAAFTTAILGAQTGAGSAQTGAGSAQAGAGGAQTGAGGPQPAADAALPQSAAVPAPSPIVRPQAVMQLDDVQQASGLTEILTRALTDASGQVREQAALGLALTPGSAVIDPLLAALKDPDSQVREKAAIGLAFRRDPRIIEPLLVAMTDEDGQVREKAAIALGASGDPRAIDSLTKATTDPDPQVREKAVAGLVLLGLRK